MGIGDRITEVRKRNGLSQAELAKRSGISQAGISYIEKGLLRMLLDIVIFLLGVYFGGTTKTFQWFIGFFQ